jgi:hypothetical protein
MEDGQMKKKALVGVLLCVLAVTALFTGTALANWHTVTITSVGATDIGYILTVTDTAGTPAFPPNTIFIIQSTLPYANQLLATSLTALANSMNMNIYTTPDSSGGNVYAVYAVK